MGKNKASAKKVQDYYDLSLNYLESAKISLKNELFEPAMFSAIHALELCIKAAVLTKTDEEWKTHNIGGQFGKYFLYDIGDKTCRRINVIISKYNLPRYPSQKELDSKEDEDDICFIEDFIRYQVVALLK